jgi:hypothetical protein
MKRFKIQVSRVHSERWPQRMRARRMGVGDSFAPAGAGMVLFDASPAMNRRAISGGQAVSTGLQGVAVSRILANACSTTNYVPAREFRRKPLILTVFNNF